MSTAFLELIKSHPTVVDKKDAIKLYQEMPDSYKACVKQDTLVNYLTAKFKQNILWHDYEAGGTHAPSVAPLQFAAIRTDLEHNVLDEPIDWYCQLAGDKLPHPVAIAITKINPMHCQKEGLPEPLFFRLIESEMALSCTCVTGYNSMGYDEEVTRFGFWRNLIPVYEREYSNHCSRWDLLPVTAAFSALSPKGISWPSLDDDQGKSKRSLKLEVLASANNITQENAHNAVDDVKALIDWSAFLKKADPNLWQHLYERRSKNKIQSNFFSGSLGILASAKAGAVNEFNHPILLLGHTQEDKNKWVAINLNDIEALRDCWHLTAEQISERLYSTKEDVEKNEWRRPPLLTIKINKSPAFFPSGWVEEFSPERWDPKFAELANKITNQPDFISRLMDVFGPQEFDNNETDIEELLYGTPFPSYKDKGNMKSLLGLPLSEAFATPLEWDNPDFDLLWKRARAKLSGYDGITLREFEEKSWQAHCDLKRKSPLDTQSKHDFVNMENVDGVLEETKMPDEIKDGYKSWIKTL